MVVVSDKTMSLALALLLAASAAHNHPNLTDRVWGMTVDDLSHVDPVVSGLSQFKVRPTARLVFDPSGSPDYYRQAVTRIHDVANVMGEPVDSAPPSGRLTVADYRRKMAAYMDGLGDSVDIWEIGNEVNGDWTGDSSMMAAKIQAGLEEARERKVRTAVTLFYSDFFKGTDREMVAWSKKYLSDSVREGVDYVLVSFYPDNATGEHPDWPTIFKDLSEAFPKAKLGFGELGLRKPDFTLSSDLTEKRKLMNRYYSMTPPIKKRWIGGYFWWTFVQDKDLWGDLRELVK